MPAGTTPVKDQAILQNAMLDARMTINALIAGGYFPVPSSELPIAGLEVSTPNTQNTQARNTAETENLSSSPAFRTEDTCVSDAWCLLHGSDWDADEWRPDACIDMGLHTDPAWRCSLHHNAHRYGMAVLTHCKPDKAHSHRLSPLTQTS